MKYVATMIYHAATYSFVSVLKKKGPPVVRGRWNFVGGKIEARETPHTAHAREALEETGIDVLEECSLVSRFTLYLPDDVEVEFARFDIHPRTETRPTLPKVNDVGERLKWTSTALSDSVVPNLNWIVPLLLIEENLTSGALHIGN